MTLSAIEHVTEAEGAKEANLSMSMYGYSKIEGATLDQDHRTTVIGAYGTDFGPCGHEYPQIREGWARCTKGTLGGFADIDTLASYAVRLL